jgi:hypothetical protein
MPRAEWLLRAIACHTQGFASRELGISEQDLEERLATLTRLLPDLAERLHRAPVKMVAQLAANTHDIAVRLLLLKRLFPAANLSVMVGNRLRLLIEDDMQDVTRAASRLRELLPGVNVDAFVADFPAVLDVEAFEMALQVGVQPMHVPGPERRIR